MGNTALERWIIGDEARFPLRFIGHGNVDLVLADQEGSTAMEFTVPFSAIWMVNPGVVEPGNSFQTEVLAAPTAEGALNKANIKISFDQERASYVGVSPVTESKLPLIIDTRLEANELSIDVSSETGIRAQDWPGGVPICIIEWNCLEKGTTCFDIAGTMSPEVDGWRLCMEQKAERENIQCICVNIIYKAWRRQDRRTGTAMVRQAVRVIGNNTYFCCPILHYDWNICEITGSMWLSITQLWGGNQEPWTAAEIAKLLDADDLCKQDDCINLYVLPIGNPNISGRSNIGSPGNMMIDPADFSTVHNLGAHEIGHALGLEHVGQSYNLMHKKQPHGHYISRDQCETIWRNLTSYPCR